MIVLLELQKISFKLWTIVLPAQVFLMNCSQDLQNNYIGLIYFPFKEEKVYTYSGKDKI